jgi:hypothetical protein
VNSRPREKRQIKQNDRVVPKVEEGRQETEAERNRPIIFSESTKKWMKGHVAANLKKFSASGYRTILDSYILPVLEDWSIWEITREEIKELCFDCLEGGRKRPITLEDETEDTSLSPRTVANIVRTSPRSSIMRSRTASSW